MSNTEYSLYYEGPFYMLGAFSAHSVTIDGVSYPTAEHAYQALKFKNSAPQIHDKILHAGSPLEAKNIKDSHKELIDTTFEERKVAIMKEIFVRKAQQHEEVRDALVKSGTSIIGEDSPVDEFRGIGKNKDGENMLGKIWMEIRKELAQ